MSFLSAFTNAVFREIAIPQVMIYGPWRGQTCYLFEKERNLNPLPHIWGTQVVALLEKRVHFPFHLLLILQDGQKSVFPH